jgi:hypothetical protein
LAEKPKRPLASRCRLVRSYSSGLAWVLGLLSSLTLQRWPCTAAAMACACAACHRRSARSSASSGFFFQAGSNHLPT